MITVAVFNVGTPLEIRSIDGSLKSMQTLVGGLIEAVHVSDELDMMVNEEGLLLNLEPNFRLGSQPIVGNVFFTRHDDEGNPVSLTEADISYLSTLCKQIRMGMRKAMT